MTERDDVQIDPVVAIVVPTAVYRCPRCNWQFLEDTADTDGTWWYCPNCNVRVLLTPISTQMESATQIIDVNQAVYES